MSLRKATLILLLLPSLAWSEHQLKLDGDFTQGGLVIGHTEPGTKVVHDGLDTRVSKDGVFLIGFGRDDPAESQLELAFANGEHLVRKLAVSQRTYDIQRVDGLPDRKVTPKPEDEKRIAEDAKAAAAARLLDDPRMDFLNGFNWPVQGRISGVYGSQRILNGVPKQPHFGVDIAGKVGTPVKAPADAVVTLAHPDMFYSGATLIMDHGHGLSSTFMHLDKILVKQGQTVKQGEVVAELGASGRVTGPHLDWRINLFKKRLDPQLLAPAMPEVTEGNP